MADRYFSTFISSDGGSTSGVIIHSGSSFTVKFPNPIDLDPHEDAQWVFSMGAITYTNSKINISVAYGNNKFYYFNGVANKIITIPDGYYQIKEFNEFIIASIKENGDNLAGDISPITIGWNKPQMKVIINVAATYTVTFPIGQALNVLLGVTAGAVLTTDYIGDTILDMNRGVNSMYILCDLVDGTDSVRFNGAVENILASVRLSGCPGSVTTYQPTHASWQPISRSVNNSVAKMKFDLVDSQFREFGALTGIDMVLNWKRIKVLTT